MKTAEWTCTRCGAINRKFVADDVTRTTDRCVSCHVAHAVAQGERPVQWRAEPAR